MDKLTEKTPMVVIESDATIVGPLMLQALLECHENPEEADAVIAESRARQKKSLGRGR